MNKRELEQTVADLETTLTAKEKTCRSLMARVEQSTDSQGGAYSIFEHNLLLHNLLDQKTEELESINKMLSQEVFERTNSEQKLYNIIQNLPLAAFVINKDHQVVQWNRALEMLSGIKRENIVGTDEHWRAFYNKEKPCLIDLLLSGHIGHNAKPYSTFGENGGRKNTVYIGTDFFPGIGEKGKWIRGSVSYITDSQGTITGAIEIVEDISQQKETERKLSDSFERLRKAMGATVQAISVIAETRDPYTAGHQHRVADLARAIGAEMGLAEDRVDGLRIASTIHDIGKIAIPSEILSKPTKLNKVEYDLIKTHPISGHSILKDIDFPWPVAQIVLEHHERINGSGYPQGLTGDMLLVESKILAVADVVESMASHRPYRPSLGIDAALEEISNNTGVLYDNDVAAACLTIFRKKGYRIKGVGYTAPPASKVYSLVIKEKK